VRIQEAAGTRRLDEAVVLGHRVLQPSQGFVWHPDEALYGLGQHQVPYVNWRGSKLTLFQKNMEVAVPVLVSDRGYAVVWDNASETRFDDTAAAGEGIGTIWSEAGRALDYYVVLGSDMDSIIAGVRRLSGAAPMYPLWAYGLFQSKEHYTCEQELQEVVEEFRRRHIPLDCIVQDWRYWSPYEWGSHAFDAARYPDVAGMIRRLHDRYGVRIMLSVWPRFEQGSDNYQELYDNNCLLGHYRIQEVSSQAGEAASGALEAYYDPFSETGRAIYWRQIKERLFDAGFDAFWLDATEPEMHFKASNRERKRLADNAAGPGVQYFNAYPLMTTKAVYEGQRSVAGDKRVYMLTRSAFTGQQRYATTVWSGDVRATWEVLRTQVAAGLNFCMTGIPYWTTDIGGFYVDYPHGCEDPAYRELFVRWFQFGAFCPVFRVHGTGTPREPWRFGKPGEVSYDTLVTFDTLRYRLLPYLYSLAWQVTSQQYTLMRHLVFDFAHDSTVADIADQYMLGPAFMVCPVLEPGARTRQVYLPQGTDWYDFWTGRMYQGGQSIEAATPLEIMPLFVRAGSVVPMAPPVQRADEITDRPLYIRIYPGADGQFVLYDDEHDNYNYEKGAWCTTGINWQDRDRRLTLGTREGGFAGMREQVVIMPVLVHGSHGAGSTETRTPLQYTYTGTSMQIDMHAYENSGAGHEK
jgi:alpha-D-xyloside xylohydrolase